MKKFSGGSQHRDPKGSPIESRTGDDVVAVYRHLNIRCTTYLIAKSCGTIALWLDNVSSRLPLKGMRH